MPSVARHGHPGGRTPRKSDVFVGRAHRTRDLAVGELPVFLVIDADIHAVVWRNIACAIAGKLRKVNHDLGFYEHVPVGRS